jgi:hypothetical protein
MYENHDHLCQMPKCLHEQNKSTHEQIKFYIIHYSQQAFKKL